MLLIPLRRDELENGGVEPDGSEEVAPRAMTDKLAYPHPALFDEMEGLRPFLEILEPDDRQRRFTK